MSAAPALAARSLLERLADRLAAAGVSYCQWKGRGGTERWLRGEGDVDLLVDPAHEGAFRAAAAAVGFKPVRLPPGRALPSTASLYGYDPRLARLVHLHVHWRLMVGDPWSTHYRLPLERVTLASAQATDAFPVPAPACELVLRVLKTVLRWSSWRALLRAPHEAGGLLWDVQVLEERTSEADVRRLLRAELPCVEPELFAACRRAALPRATLRQRIRAHLALRRCLRPFAVAPGLLARLARVARALARRPRARKRLERGVVIALLGGDGAGKSTAARALDHWLAPEFLTLHAHLGRPPRSLLTLVVGALLKVRQLFPARQPPLLEMLRHLCTGRDRHRLYVRAARCAAAGGIAVCERYPTPENRPLSGPRVRDLAAGRPPSALLRRLWRIEERYYETMLPPDVVFVLRVDPETAARRKRDEPADYVRARTLKMWETDWSRTNARVIDAGHPLPEMLGEIKWQVWDAL